MNKTARKIACAVSALLMACSFASCAKNGNEEVTSESYVYHAADETTVAQGESESGEKKEIAIDKSWRDDFDVIYSYYNVSQSEDKISVHEKRSENYFSAEDTQSGDMLYYEANGNDIDSYVIVPDEEEQVHTVIVDKTLADLSSTFMKLSEIDADLPALSNVMYMYDEEVAGRPCEKYIQRSYEDGEATETVYVWIDKEFGFAAKGEVYDKNTKLTASWEMTSFSAGGVKDADVKKDLSGYRIVEG